MSLRLVHDQTPAPSQHQMEQSPFDYGDADMTDPTPQREETRPAVQRGRMGPSFLRRMQTAAQDAMDSSPTTRRRGQRTNSRGIGRSLFMGRLGASSARHDIESPTNTLGATLDAETGEDALATPTPAVPSRRPRPKQPASFRLPPPRHLPSGTSQTNHEDQESPTRQRPRQTQPELQQSLHQYEPDTSHPHPPTLSRPPLSPAYSTPVRSVYLVVYMEYPIPVPPSSAHDDLNLPISSDIRCFHPSLAISYDHTSVPRETDSPRLRLEFWTLPGRNHAVVPQVLNFVVRVLCGVEDGGVEHIDDQDQGEETYDQGPNQTSSSTSQPSPLTNPPSQHNPPSAPSSHPPRPSPNSTSTHLEYRQVWLKGWAENRAEAAWIIEEAVRKENRDSRGFSTLGKGWKWGTGRDGVLERAMNVDKDRGMVKIFGVFEVGVEE